MNRRTTRLAWTMTLLFGIVMGGLGVLTTHTDAEAKGTKTGVLDVGISGICRNLRAGGGVVVTVNNLGTLQASGIVVTGGTIYDGGEYVLAFERTLSGSLASGASKATSFSNQEIVDQDPADNVIYVFSVSLAQGDDARPDNDNRNFHQFGQIRPCPLNVTRTL